MIPPAARFGFKTRCAVNNSRALIRDHHSASGSALHHVGLVLDGNAKVGMLTLDGVLCDGGDDPDAGEGFWFGPGSTIGALSGSELATCTLPPTHDLPPMGSAVSSSVRTHRGVVRVYRRALRVSELVGAWKAGRATNT